MQITFKTRLNNLATSKISAGVKLTGLRIRSFTLESAADVKAICTPEGQRWLQEHVVVQFHKDL